MGLSADKKRVAGRFNHLHQRSVGACAGYDETPVGKLLTVGIIYFVSVAMPLDNFFLAI